MKLVQVWLIVNPEKSGGMYMSSVTGTEIGDEGEQTPEGHVALGKPANTRKRYVAMSPVLPVAVTLYVPGRTLATTKEPDVILPPVIVQLVGGRTGMPENEQLVSLKENPTPVPEMVIPGGSNDGLSVICGGGGGGGVVVTAKNVDASPVSPPLVVAVIV